MTPETYARKEAPHTPEEAREIAREAMRFTVHHPTGKHPPMEVDLSTLNPGIRRVVAYLFATGFVPTDSGDGKTHEHDCDLPFPYVHMIVPSDREEAEIERLHAAFGARGIVLHPALPDEERPCWETHGPDGQGLSMISPLSRADPQSP
jgi:hypothetical protein